MNRFAVIFVLLLIIVTNSCKLRHNEYSYFTTFDDTEWSYSDSLRFTPTIDDSVATGRLAVCVRHTNAYPYSNLWLELKYPVDDSTFRADTLEIQIADAFGRWKGHGSGASYQLADTVYHRFKLFNRRPVQLRHIMRVDTLRQIEQIGISFTPNEEL